MFVLTSYYEFILQSEIGVRGVNEPKEGNSFEPRGGIKEKKRNKRRREKK